MRSSICPTRSPIVRVSIPAGMTQYQTTVGYKNTDGSSLNVQVALGEGCEVDLAGYATIASTMLRIGSRLGLARRPRDVTLTLGQVLRRGADND